MKKGYSKLLICEVVITTEVPSPDATGLDLLMMGGFGAGERTEDDWRQLLGEAGYRLARLFAKPGAIYGVIEAEVA